MLSPRLSGIAVLGTLALVLSGCSSDSQTNVGVNEIRLATLGSVDASQQAFIDRMNQLSEGSMTLTVTQNWTPSGGSDSDEVAITKAVLAGDIDIAWVTVRSLTSIGVTGIDALETPFLVQTHDQQRAVALGVPGELITDSMRKLPVAGLALLPGPEQFPLASGAPLLAGADWTGKTVQVSSLNAIESAAVQALGATPSADGPSSVADVVAGTTEVTTADPADLVASGVVKAGPFLSNVALWPRMSMILINRDVLDRLSNRQHGFLDGSVVRAQDIAMATPDTSTTISDACAAGVLFAPATADQLTALLATVQPVYTALAADPTEAKLLASIQDAVKRTAGNGAFPVPKKCRWVAPK
ncbi:MAG: hypothetical protein ABI632_03180 [Pseudolysinimonas sp.]